LHHEALEALQWVEEIQHSDLFRLIFSINTYKCSIYIWACKENAFMCVYVGGGGGLDNLGSIEYSRN